MFLKNFIIVLCVSVCSVQAQQIESKVYFDEDGFQCGAERANWYRSYQLISDSSVLIRNYSNDSKIILMATGYCESHGKKVFMDRNLINQEVFDAFSKRCSFVYDGEIKEFYRNGNLNFVGKYYKGKRVGIFNRWYFNGNKKDEIEYNDSLVITDSYRILNYYDSIGNHCVKNGEGTYIAFDKNNLLIDSGKISNGLKEGLWTGTFKKGKSKFKEHYLAGLLQGGESTDSLQTTFHYKTVYGDANYANDGLQGISRFVSNNLKYPDTAKRKGIEGRVLVEFIINTQGSVENVKIKSGVSDDCDAEAIRVVKLLDSFKPATYKGQSVRSRYILPISYRMN